MLSFVEKYAYNVHSQNGEDGILMECIRRIGCNMGTAIEFGAPTVEYCSNINNLTVRNKLFYDIQPTGKGVIKKEITPANVNDLPPCNVLSIDIDGNDYVVWQAYNGRPDIVIIEINSSLPPMKAWFSPESGSSYVTMLLLGLVKGYFLLCHTGNLVFVRNDHRGLFPEIVGDGLNNWEEYFNKSWL